jgi:hypothetical protein
LEKIWEKIGSDGPDRNVINGDLPYQGTAVGEFMFYIKFGFYPPPEVLVTLMQCFHLYVAAEGSLELEEVFFGSRVPGSGNFSARRFGEFLYRKMYLVAKNESDASLEKKAEGLLDFYDVDKDVSTFLRGYRRWKTKTEKGSEH